MPDVRRARLMRFVGGLLLMLAACARPAAQQRTPAHVVVGVSMLRISQPVFVAVDRGLFAKHELEVELRRFDTAQPLADELAAGRIDAAGYIAFPILFGRQPPPPVRVVTAIVEDAEHPISFLLVKKGSGLKGVAALRGKKIGILPTAAYQRWLVAILANEGIASADVSILPVAPGLQVEALAGGGIDALFTGDPMATAALARDVAETATSTPDVPRVFGSPFVFGTFAIAAPFAEQHPEAAGALRDSLDEAIALLAADPSLGKTVMAGVVRDSERPFVAGYPSTKFLKSTELTTPLLGRALELAGTALKPSDVSSP